LISIGVRRDTCSLLSGAPPLILVHVKTSWSFRAPAGRALAKASRERLKKLAARIDALAKKDESTIRRAREISSLRRQAALELHGACADFVRELNELLSEPALELDPAEYEPANFQERAPNLFQINTRGRIVQTKFEATPELISTEDFRIPYILSGAIRCFNQQLLEQDLIEEQLLFYTLEKSRYMWRFFDARTHRSGRVDTNYLACLLEQLV
jgi:hypothetical protein